jgi:hypothetical protein
MKQTRAQPDEVRALAVARLLNFLEMANQVYVRQSDRTRSRYGAIVALGAICDFVKTVAEPRARELNTPLHALIAALYELDRGFISPMLKRSQRPGHRDSYSREITKGCAAAAMSLLIDKGGLEREVAAKQVADRV